ncbi:MAG TPA: hypothetical protein V6D17_00345, partial [Candidatus Obscuribacterales bacterium]
TVHNWRHFFLAQMCSCLCAFITLLAGAAAPAADQKLVIVQKKPPQIETRVFHKDDPTSEVPLKTDRDATTNWDFHYVVDLSYDIASSKKTGEDTCVVIKITRAHIKLELPMVIWIPENVDEKLLSHEDGHKQIAEDIYKNADAVAADQARAMLNATFTGKGKNEHEACADAVHAAATELNRQYRKEVLDYSKRASDLYDDLTQHGKNKRPVFLAVREALFRTYLDRMCARFPWLRK